jgi:hypothetical protein
MRNSVSELPLEEEQGDKKGEGISPFITRSGHLVIRRGFNWLLHEQEG